MNKKEKYKKQLENLLSTHKEYKSKSQYNDLSDLPKEDRQSLVTQSIAAVERISGKDSTYSREISRIRENYPELHLHTSPVMGVVKSLKEDIDSGSFQAEESNQTSIVAAAGGGGGGGAGPGGGRGGDGGSVNIGTPPEEISIDNIKKPHRQYWKMIFRNIVRWIRNHVLGSIIGGLIVAAILIWLGFQ